MNLRAFLLSLLLSFGVASPAFADVPPPPPEPKPSPQGAPSELARRLVQKPRYLGPQLTVQTAKGDYMFTVALARTPHERQMGLMWVEHLPPELGMFFVMQDQRVQAFWMLNTLIPLDIIFIDENFRVVGFVENAEPRTTSERKVDAPSRYVLELAGGRSREIGLKAGDLVIVDKSLF